MKLAAPRSRAVRHFIALAAGNYGALVIGLGVNALLTRRLGTESYGRLALMLMASQVLLLVAVNWTHAGFIRFGSEEYEGEKRVSGTLSARLGILLPAAAIGVLGLILGREPIANYLDIPVDAVWWIVVHFFGIATLSIVGGVLQASDRMSEWGLCLFLDKFLVAAGLLILPGALLARPGDVLVLYAASSTAISAWALARVGIAIVKPTFPGRATTRKLAAFSAPLVLSSWAGLFGTNWFDLVILKAYVSVGEIGVYSLATQLSGVVQQVTIVVSTLLLPRLSLMVAGGETGRIRAYLERLLPYWILAASGLFSIGILAAGPVIPWVFGEEFAGAVPLFAVLMVATSSLAVFNSCAPLITAYGETWNLTFIALASALANVGLNLVLIPSFGTIGSAAATAIAYGLSAVLVLVLLQRRLDVRIGSHLVLCLPALATCVAFVRSDGSHSYLLALLAAVTTCAVLVRSFRLTRIENLRSLEGLSLPLPGRFRTGD